MEKRLSGPLQHDVPGLICEDSVRAQRLGARGGTPGCQLEGVLVQGTDDHVVVDRAVRYRAAFVRADAGHSPAAIRPVT